MSHPTSPIGEEEGYALVPVMYYTVHLLTDNDGNPIIWNPKHAAEYNARGILLEAAYRAAANRSSSKPTECNDVGTRFEEAQRAAAHQSSSKAAEHNSNAQSSSKAAEHNSNAMRIDEARRAAINRSPSQATEHNVSTMQLDEAQPPIVNRPLNTNDRPLQLGQPIPMPYTFGRIPPCVSQPRPQPLKNPSTSDNTTVIKEEEILVYCPQCHKGFTKVYNLKRHRTTVHRSKKELGEAGKLYMCKLNGCTKAYKNPSDAARHRKVCTTGKDDTELVRTGLASAGLTSMRSASVGSPSASSSSAYSSDLHFSHPRS
ncbi:hypothetical protein DFH28DRAFT_1116977 [Melampsora americana]|nr:hypothetical protein DFH28DRAFT_1116977 [Melampsora americana]